MRYRAIAAARGPPASSAPPRWPGPRGRRSAAGTRRAATRRPPARCSRPRSRRPTSRSSSPTATPWPVVLEPNRKRLPDGPVRRHAHQSIATPVGTTVRRARRSRSSTAPRRGPVEDRRSRGRRRPRPRSPRARAEAPIRPSPRPGSTPPRRRPNWRTSSWTAARSGPVRRQGDRRAGLSGPVRDEGEDPGRAGRLLGPEGARAGGSDGDEGRRGHRADHRGQARLRQDHGDGPDARDVCLPARAGDPLGGGLGERSRMPTAR